MVLISYFVDHGNLMQNEIDIITKCDSFILQNATKVYCKMRQVFYYKMRQLITTCNSCWKVR